MYTQLRTLQAAVSSSVSEHGKIETIRCVAEEKLGEQKASLAIRKQGRMQLHAFRFIIMQPYEFGFGCKFLTR